MAYLRKHFQILAQTTDFLVDGFQSVPVVELLQRVLKDVQDHPPVVSEDSNENQAGLEVVQATCQSLEKAFVNRQGIIGRISWPQLVYFARYHKYLTSPGIFPLSKPQRVGDKKVAEVVPGLHSSRVLILYFDGTVEVWNLTGNNATQVSSIA